MICTEAEAKTKWCPFYRVVISGGVDTYDTDNRPLEYKRVEDKPEAPWQPTGNILPQGACIGSRCMTWQWSSPRQAPAGVEIGDSGFCGMIGSRGY